MPKNRKAVKPRSSRRKSAGAIETWLERQSQTPATDAEALDLLVKIVRGEQLELSGDEIKPATLSQRMTAAQILLRLRDKDPKDHSTNDQGVSVHPLAYPERAKNFDEWLARQQKMQATKTPNNIE
jgi:hypothetical protein